VFQQKLAYKRLATCRPAYVLPFEAFYTPTMGTIRRKLRDGCRRRDIVEIESRRDNDAMKSLKSDGNGQQIRKTERYGSR
jgi:hypothetical protein